MVNVYSVDFISYQLNYFNISMTVSGYVEFLPCDKSMNFWHAYIVSSFGIHSFDEHLFPCIEESNLLNMSSLSSFQQFNHLGSSSFPSLDSLYLWSICSYIRSMIVKLLLSIIPLELLVFWRKSCCLCFCLCLALLLLFSFYLNIGLCWIWFHIREKYIFFNRNRLFSGVVRSCVKLLYLSIIITSGTFY